MLAEDSPLRRLPVELDRKQALFFDGIRHAIELADLAYERLVVVLTDLAMGHTEGRVVKGYTAPFLDAWAIVDAIDRLRGLVHLLPGSTQVPRGDGLPGFRELTAAIREIRNVSDHLAGRADYVVARNGTALGVLSWITIIDQEHMLCCAIVPGTIANKEVPLPNPIGRDLLGPSDFISLAAGEHSACLSDAMKEAHRRVEGIEAGLGSWLRDNGFDGKNAPVDMLAWVKVQIVC
jgi:hypothetical protein